MIVKNYKSYNLEPLNDNYIGALYSASYLCAHSLSGKWLPSLHNSISHASTHSWTEKKTWKRLGYRSKIVTGIRITFWVYAKIKTKNRRNEIRTTDTDKIKRPRRPYMIHKPYIVIIYDGNDFFRWYYQFENCIHLIAVFTLPSAYS